jgi:iron complex transport system substrate-binding protein
MNIPRKSFVFVILCSLLMACSAFGEPIEVTDIFNRTITLNNIPQRIACLYAFSGHVATMLGGGDRIVAVVPGLKRDLLLNQLNPAIQDALTPSSGGTINIEELLRAKPDLVFLKEENAHNEAEVQKLERFNLPYLVVGYSSMEEQMASIEMIGKAIGLKSQADAYNSYYRDVVERVSARVRDIPESERYRVYHSVNEATRTDAPGTLEADWTSVTGMINVSVGEPLRVYDNANFASMEQILLWDPDVIIANEEGVDQYILTNKKWASLKAVKTGKVYKIPNGISRWGHPGGLETPLAILWTVKTLYPNVFTDLSLEDIIRDFYARFFNYAISAEMTGKILSGRGMRLPKTKQQ